MLLLGSNIEIWLQFIILTCQANHLVFYKKYWKTPSSGRNKQIEIWNAVFSLKKALLREIFEPKSDLLVKSDPKMSIAEIKKNFVARLPGAFEVRFIKVGNFAS